ncbi:15638_t:CDS:2, partial [Acaulospora colombiana]
CSGNTADFEKFKIAQLSVRIRVRLFATGRPLPPIIRSQSTAARKTTESNSKEQRASTCPPLVNYQHLQLYTPRSCSGSKTSDFPPELQVPSAGQSVSSLESRIETLLFRVGYNLEWTLFAVRMLGVHCRALAKPRDLVLTLPSSRPTLPL